jgi:hypothetical protein
MSNTTTPIHLSVDHVTIAGPELAPLEQAFADVGLTTDYGGPHSNKITHMALLGLIDGSYIELISSLFGESRETHAFWGEHIAANGGPCAWAVRADDVAAEAARVAVLGIPAEGPVYYSRRRPDHAVVEWDMAFLGDLGAGAILPFIIKDITPREVRVKPSASVADGLLTGVDTVMLAVETLQPAIELFQRVYRWPTPQLKNDAAFGAKLAAFQNTPVVLAAPLTSQSWLSERLARFGPSPCAFLIGTSHMDVAVERYKLVEERAWFDHRLAWFDPVRMGGYRLGVVGP